MIVVTAGAAWSAPVSGIYEYEIQIGSNGKPAQKMTTKVWAKGNRYRTETTMPNGKNITIQGPEGRIMMIPGRSEAMKMPMPPGAKAAGGDSPLGDMDKIKKMKKVGTEKVAGNMAAIYEESKTMQRPGAPGAPPTPIVISSRYWITGQSPVPVKITNKTPMADVTMTLKSAQPKAAVPDSMFQVPKGVTVRDMKMPPGMPTAPKGK